MSGFYGANTDQLRDHAQQMAQRAQRLIELREQLTPHIMDEGIWRGPDADDFRQRWSGDIASQFDQRSEDIRRRGTDLDKEAEEQDTVSNEGGEGDGKSKGPFDFLKDFLKAAQKISSIAKKIADIKKYIDIAKKYGDDVAKMASKFKDEIFKHGKGWQAMAEKLFDKLGLPSSFGPKGRIMQFLNKLDNVAPFLKTAGKWGGRLLPGVDIITGGIQAFNGFKNGDVFSGITGSATALSGALMLAAPFTGPAAPFVAGAGAVLGIGAAAADLGKMAWDNREAIGNAIGGAVSAAGDAIGSVASAAGDAIGNAASAAGDAIGNAASAAGDAIGRIFSW